MKNLDLARKRLDAIAKKIRYRKVSFRSLSRTLNKEFKYLSTKFMFRANKSVEPNTICCNGYYNPPNIEEDHRYSVIIYYNHKDTYIKPRRGFFTEIYLVLAHEYRHGHQYRARKFRIRKHIMTPLAFRHINKWIEEQVNYLSDYDEIDAYAFESAESIKMGGKEVPMYTILPPYNYKAWKRFKKKVYLLTHK